MIFHGNPLHALFVIFEKAIKFEQIIGGAVWVKYHLYHGSPKYSKLSTWICDKDTLSFWFYCFKNHLFIFRT